MTSRNQSLGAGIQNGGLIQPVFPVKVGDVTCLAEAVHAKRHHLLPAHRTKPGMGRRVAIQHCHHGSVRG